MIVPRATRDLILQHLFKTGGVVVKEEFTMKTHPNIAAPNIHVLYVMKSLCSCKLVRKQFSWMHHYYFLNDAGIAAIRDHFGLPDDVQPDIFCSER
ncbi:hypothetical protein PCE1_004889 [Barthelona sp. PCE]